VVLISCAGNDEMTTQEMGRNVGPDEVINNLVMTATTGEDIEWQMTAELAKRFNSQRKWIAYDVILETINQEDTNFYRSDSVYVLEIEDEFIGMGNVEIINQRGLLRTDKIIWYRKSDRIFAPNLVYLNRDDHEMWGENLFTNSSLDYIEMQNVRGHGTIDESLFTD
jgi:predicted transcriptional regulator